MNSHKSIFKILIVVFCLFIGGIVTQMDASAYFNPKVKKSSNGNWMQCYALQYEKKTGGGTFLSGAQIGHVASTDRLCAYVDSEGKMITGNVSLASNPSGTASFKEDLKGKGNPKVYFDVKNKKKIDFYQCNDGSFGSECYSELAKSWNTKKGDNFEKLAKEINDFANEKYGDYTKMVFSNNSNSGSLTQDLSTEAGSNENDDENGSSEIIEDCANQGGAQSLGWIICPIMSLLGDAAEGLYNSAVEPALNIEPKLFSDSDTNTADAWGLFRNIANIIFVILMLLVIFSQLTGVGIDNYGIKKILPKLIVVAVLTNLSYVLCVLAIDVSNILGNSFQGLFEGMRQGLNLTLDFNDGTVIGNQIKSTAYSMVGVGVLSALVGMSGAIWQSPMVALSLLLGAIGVVISIFFLFVLLAAREAAIVVLVVLAPVAMVLYALPNTKKVFDKWLKAFEGLLLVYPIAGLLVGGGNYVSALLIHSGMGSDFFGALTAMIAGVLPIFFIPTMLKGSFSALGTIGARISGFGAGASRGVTRALGNSGVYKNAQESARMWADRKQAGTGDISEMGRFGRFIRGNKRGITAARARNIRNVKDYGNRELLATGAGYGAALAGAESENMKQRVAGYESMLSGDNDLGVNANSVDSLSNFHRDALSEYANASTNDEKNTAMAKIRAVQNIMSKTDPGRSAVATNIANSVTAGGNSAVAASNAASHLMSEYGDLYKTKNRGTEQMLRDLTGANGSVNMESIAERINNKTYGMAGTNKYTEETLAGADEAALKGLVANLGKMNDEQLQNIQGTASRAIQKSMTGSLNVKPEVLRELEKINNYRKVVDNTGDFIPE